MAEQVLGEIAERQRFLRATRDMIAYRGDTSYEEEEYSFHV